MDHKGSLVLDVHAIIIVRLRPNLDLVVVFLLEGFESIHDTSAIVYSDAEGNFPVVFYYGKCRHRQVVAVLIVGDQADQILVRWDAVR